MKSRRFAVLLGLSAFGLWAQTDRSTITGTVTDPAGAVVPMAPIEARNTQTGAVYQAVTTPTGNYNLSEIPAGSYELSATAPGFKRYIRTGITVPVAQTLRIDIALEVGATTESLTVTAEAPLLKTESGEVSHNISAERMNNLPLLPTGGGLGIRNPYSVVNLLPGTDFRPEASVRINGLPGNSQALRVEGQDSTNITWQSTTQIIQQSVDAVQEVGIHTSNFAAEYGQAGSAVFNMTMKSGANQFHLSAYDYFVNEALNSGRPFLNVNPVARRNDYGFSLGGPVVVPKVYNGHDRFFFFFNFEQFRENIGTASVNTVPTDLMRQGNFSQILTGRNICPAANPNCDPLGRPIFENTLYDPRTERVANGQRVRDSFPRNIIDPLLFNQVALKIQKYFPEPNRPGLVSNYQSSYTNPRLTYIPSVKVDYNLSSRAKLSGYWSETRADSPNNDIWSPLPISGAVHRTSQADTVRINYDYTLTPTMLLHVGIGLIHLTDNQATAPFNQLQTLGLPGSQSNAFPYLQGLGTSSFGGITPFLGALGPIVLARINNIKPTAVTSFTWVKNNHTYKFGGEMIVESFPSYSETFANNWYNFSAATTGISTQLPLSGATGFPYASFLLGQVNNGTVNVPSRGHLGDHAIAFFAQDSWRVTSKLTLDYGLRYDFQTYLKEEYGRWANFSPTTLNPKAGNLPGAIIYEGSGPGRCNCSYAKNYPYAFGPRLSLAYQFVPKTVLRAGIGVTYGRTPELGYLDYTLSVFGGYSSPSFADPATSLSQGPPIPWSWPNFDPGLFVTPNGPLSQPTVAIDQNAGRPPRTVMWSIGIERELAPNLIVEASYVGNRGAWFQGNPLTNPNAISLQRLSQFGLDINNPEVQTLLTLPVNSPLAQKYGIKIPYVGFSPTNTVAQAIRAYPQYGTFSPIWAPLGRTWYDALQVSATKRFSKGFDFNTNFAWQKELDMGVETTYNLFATIAPQVNDVFNRPTNKYISGLSRPFVYVFAGNYTTQSWISNKAVNWVIKDWTIGAILRYQSGQPIRVPNANSIITTQLGRGGNTFANRVPGQPLFLKDLNKRGSYDPTRDFVLNPAAWTEPAPGQFGSSAAYYNDYRYQRRPQENMSIGKSFRFHEGRLGLMIRAEFTNIFNRTWYPDPVSTSYTAQQLRNGSGATTGGFGWVNVLGALPLSQGLAPRQGTLVGRFTF